MRHLLNIGVRTIPMKPFSAEGRRPFHNDELNKRLLSGEAALRKQAYKNINIKTDEVFFNDSDMNCNYNLLVVYDKYSFVPLLTARYYSDSDLIAGVLRGDDQNDSRGCEDGIFLVDRMCANVASSLYRRKRSYINLLFYSELMVHNSNSSFFAMARKEPGNKLLNKYLHLGLQVTGLVKHKGREHWLLRGNMKESYSITKMSPASKIFLSVRTWIKSLGK